jgi:transcriptional regulator with XRE-family HTH domain
MHTNGNHLHGNDLDPAPVTIGTKIKQARLAAGLTRAQLGDKAKVSAKTIENWEGDQSEPPLKRLKALGRILDVPLQEFFDEIEDENGNGDSARDPVAHRDEEVRRTAQKLARLLGGTMVFGTSHAADPAPVHPEPESVEELLGAAEFDELRRVVENRGTTSAAVPARVKALDEVLSTAGPDELRELAETRDVPLFECAPIEGETKSDEVQCAMQAQLVLGGLGYPDLSLLTFEGAQDLKSRLERALDKAANFEGLDGGEWEWSKKAQSEWVAKARPFIARNLVAAFSVGKGMLPKEGAIMVAPTPKKARPSNGNKSKPKKRVGMFEYDE